MESAVATATEQIDHSRNWVPRMRVRGGSEEFVRYYRVDTADLVAARSALNMPQRGDPLPGNSAMRALDIDCVLIAAKHSFWEVVWRFEAAGGSQTPEDTAQPGDAYTSFSAENVTVQVETSIDPAPNNKLLAPDTIETPRAELQVHIFSDGSDIESILGAAFSIAGKVNSDAVVFPSLWRIPGAGISALPGQMLARAPIANFVRDGVCEVIIPFGYGPPGAWKSRQRAQDNFGRAVGPEVVRDKYPLVSYAPVAALWSGVAP